MPGPTKAGWEQFNSRIRLKIHHTSGVSILFNGRLIRMENVRQACAGEGVWTPDVAGAWRDVMSFAILAVVERTVESWGSTHGTSLSEVQLTVQKWWARFWRRLLCDRRGCG